MSIVVVILSIVLAALALCIVLQAWRAKRVVRSLSAVDREFIADQFEPFTRAPLLTAEDEDAWEEAKLATFQRISEHFPEFYREVLPRFLPYFNDADIFRREPSYRAARERAVIDFIHELRARRTKA